MLIEPSHLALAMTAPHACEHHFQRIVEPKEHLAQGANNRTLAEIKHELDCRLRLLRQNPSRRIARDLAADGRGRAPEHSGHGPNAQTLELKARKRYALVKLKLLISWGRFHLHTLIE